MRPYLIAVCFLFIAPDVRAWNAAGHRLVAAIAWQQLSPASQDFVTAALAAHPDHTRWGDRARSVEPAAIFAEASTWPDDIRSDPRFHDADRDNPTPPLPGFSDSARHKDWHYVDLDRHGKAAHGEVDRQIERLTRLLYPEGASYGARSTRKINEISYALPWLLHLVADIHQPLHVGHDDDDGGTKVKIENPFNKRLPVSSLHLYWDDLPGPPWLRGKRLDRNVQRLLAAHPAPVQGDVALWLQESHALLASAYPVTKGDRLPVVSEDFNRQAHAIANRRLVEAGYRLGNLLETVIGARVSRETH